VEKPVASRHEIWTVRHCIRRVPRGQVLRIILAHEAEVVSSVDAWKTVKKTTTLRNEPLGLSYIDFPTENLRAGTVLEFTFFWKKCQQWEGRNFAVTIE
jgi:glucoamylase